MAKHIGDLAERHRAADRLEHRRHEVVVAARRALYGRERLLGRGLVALIAHGLDVLDLRALDLVRDLERRDAIALALVDVLVDADDGALPRVDLALELVRRVGDLALRVALLDGAYDPAQLVDLVDV